MKTEEVLNALSELSFGEMVQVIPPCEGQTKLYVHLLAARELIREILELPPMVDHISENRVIH